MITISTYDGTRTYRVPTALGEVAIAVTGETDVRDAVFALARRLTANDFHTVENVAKNISFDAAVQFAKERLVLPKSRWPQPAVLCADGA